MYLLYLDDSGSSTISQQEYSVLGGLAVPENSLRWLSFELEKFAQAVGDETSFDPKKKEFHASEIFSGRIAPR